MTYPRCFRILPLILIIGLLPAALAKGQIQLGVRGGYNLDAFSDSGAEDGAFTLGGEARLGLNGLPIVLNPGADYYFNGIDNTTVWQFDANVLYPISHNNMTFTPYVGAGLGVTRVSFDPDTGLFGRLINDKSSESDIGLNVLGGATFGFGAIRPFAEAQITMGDHLAFMNRNGDGGPGYALIGGILFKIGT